MIIKKLYRKCNFKWYNRKRKVHELISVKEYIGWFLFGFIPIYLIELDKYDEVDFENTGKDTMKYGINEKYKHLMIKEK
jgi:hypothetical protein